MTLRIEQLCFDNFRGYRHLELCDLTHLTIFAGPNAVGKTNIVEGVQLLTSGESFRKPDWNETVSWGCESASLKAVFADGKRKVDHKLCIHDGKRVYEVNGKRKLASQVSGTCPAVLFIPDHLQMVKASSAQRRNAVDSIGVQLSKNYAQLRSEYNQTLKQRNQLIRDELCFGPLFESWNERLAITGARLCANRYKLFMRLARHMASIYEQIVPGEKLEAVYIPSWARFDEGGRQLSDVMMPEQVSNGCDMAVESVEAELNEAVSRLFPMEVRRRTSLFGPHKDEIAFFINGRNARMFASQGQQRTIVLVWKLAEVELVKDIIDQQPVLLLDDVMSELDERHRDALTAFIESSAQTFITTTNLGYFSQQLLDQAKVVEVPIPGTRYEY